MPAAVPGIDGDRGGRPRYDAVFLDRDGVINVPMPDGEYVTSPAGLVLVPGAAAAIQRLAASGSPVLVITNQRWVAWTEGGVAALSRIHDRLRARLRAEGARLTAIFACVHDAGRCRCRKPQPGLVYRALRHHRGIDPARCALVGDRETDIDVARHFAMTSVRLGPPDVRTAATHVAATLSGAADVLLDG
jgi:D-glycero-D-manno-heptose 1,7-bisphosphate phosphatase